jgi:hypothetical protein
MIAVSNVGHCGRKLPAGIAGCSEECRMTPCVGHGRIGGDRESKPSIIGIRTLKVT